MISAAAFLLPWALAASAETRREAYPPDLLSLSRLTTEVRLSPDGLRAVFATDITGAQEVWSIEAGEAAAPSWPAQLSSLGQQASDLSFSPDGGAVLFASDYGGDERRDLYLVPAGGGPTVRLTSTTASETSPSFSPEGGRVAYTADPEGVFQLFVLDLNTRAVRRLTDEKSNVTGPVWSPDGRTIAATRTPDDESGELLWVDAASGTVRVQAPPTAGGIVLAKAFSPDGRWLLCAARNAEGFLQPAVIPAGGGPPRFWGGSRWDVDTARWSPSGVYFTRNEGGRSALYRITPAEVRKALAPGGGAPRVTTLLPASGVIAAFDLDRSGSRLAYLWEDSRHPADVWLLDLRSGRRRQATLSLMGGVDPGRLAPAETFAYKSFDGTPVEAFLFEPPVPRLGLPPPAVVQVHGGPDWQARDEFYPERQALAEAGFAVVVPNFRGSSGYGRAFQDLNRGDWGGGDLKDIQEAVRLLGEKGRLDPRRAGITGGSFGGYMTLLALAKSPGTWAAGVEAYGMADLVQDYQLTRDRFGSWYASQMGTPASEPELFRDRSPINFLDRMRAPLLIFQGANDTNVPRAESAGIVERLKALGLPAEYVEYPDEGHGFTRRANRADYYGRTVDFFVRRLGAPAPAPAGGTAGAGPKPESGARAGASPEEEALAHLRALIRIDTSNPPGREIEAAKYLKGALDKEGVASEILAPPGAPERASLVARLKGSGRKRPLLLMCHTDVVPADRSRWTADPFGAEIKDGFVYGRGAADVKGMCAAELMVLAMLKRGGVRLARDVIFFAEADEEADGADRPIRWLMKERFDELDAEYGINEGGQALWDGSRISEIDLQCAEKQYLDLKLESRGPEGHSSMPLEASAISSLSRALERLGAWEPPVELTPLASAYLASLPASEGEAKAAAEDLRKGGLSAVQAARRLAAASPELGAMVRDTCSATIVKAGYKDNVIPGRAEAVVNCRLLPGREAGAFVSGVTGVLKEPSVKVSYDPPGLPPVPSMPIDGEFVEAVKAAAGRLAPGAPVRPYMAVWSTDSQELRARGVKMYGLDVPMPGADIAREHGDDERLPVAALGAYVRLLYDVTVRLAGAAP